MTEYISDEEINFIYKTIFFVSIAFLLLFIIVGFNAHQEEVFGSIKYTNGDMTSNYFLLNDNQTYNLSYEIPYKNFVYVKSQEFCFETLISGDNSTLIGFNTSGHYEQKYFTNGRQTVCQEFINSTRTGSIAFSCLNCGINKTVFLYKNSLDSFYFVNGQVFYGDNPYLYISNNTTYKYWFKTLLWFYFSFLALQFMIFLIILGLNYIKKMVFEGW